MNVLAIAAVVCGQLGICYVGVFGRAAWLLGPLLLPDRESGGAIAIYVLAAGSHAVEAHW
jgi:hypothetical protein